MDYAAKVWVGICGGFVLICGILLYTGGLVWTDKIEQLEIAQTRVIDMNAEPVQKDSKPKYCIICSGTDLSNWMGQKEKDIQEDNETDKR